MEIPHANAAVGARGVKEVSIVRERQRSHAPGMASLYEQFGMFLRRCRRAEREGERGKRRSDAMSGVPNGQFDSYYDFI